MRPVVGEPGARGDAGEVGARAGLRHGDRGHGLAGQEAGEPALLLLLAAELEQVRQDEAGVHGLRAEPDSRAPALLADHGLVGEVGDARAAVLLGHVDAEDAEVAELAVQLAGDMALPLPVSVVGGDLLGDEVADGRPECLVVLGEHPATHGHGSFLACPARSPNRA